MAKERAGLKGTRDVHGRNAAVKRAMLDEMQRAFRAYGYNYLETPHIEMLETLTSKFAGGEEIIDEIFKLTDRGKRELALRYDHTIPLARFVSQHPEISLPYKRYTLGSVFRDGPIRKGRLREFSQADADIVGVKGPEAELELLSLAEEIFSRLGIDAEIRINSRVLLEAILQDAGIKNDNYEKTMLSIDKLEKIGEQKVREELLQRGIDDDSVSSLFTTMQQCLERKPAQIMKLLLDGKPPKETVARIEESVRQIEFILKRVKTARLDIKLARGLNYYTGMLFEAFATDSAMKSSIAAGGRYRSIFSKDTSQECSGISFGIDAMLESDIGLGRPKKPRVYIVPVKEFDSAFEISKALRKENIECGIDLLSRGMTRNIRYATANNYDYILVVGKKEIDEGKYSLKNLDTGKEEKLAIEEIIRYFAFETL